MKFHTTITREQYNDLYSFARRTKQTAAFEQALAYGLDAEGVRVYVETSHRIETGFYGSRDYNGSFGYEDLPDTLFWQLDLVRVERAAYEDKVPTARRDHQVWLLTSPKVCKSL